VPDETTLIRWANTLRLETLHTLNDRVVHLAVQAKVTKGRKLRLDATCVQTNIHHPTDSGLLVDSVRVLSRFVQRAKGLVKEQVRNVQQTCRSRLRSARQAAQTLHRQLRRKGEEKEAEQKKLYEKLIQTAEQMVRQSRQVVAVLSKQTQQQAHRLLEQAQQVLPLVQRVIAQTRSRVLEGRSVASADKVLSLFEPHTRAIPRHKGGALVEFGRQVILDEVEGGIVTRYQILEHRCRAWAGFGRGGASPDDLCAFAQPGGRRPRGPFSRDGVTTCSSRSQTGGDPSCRPCLEGTSGLGAHARL
jgi:transposase, IS5 family